MQVASDHSDLGPKASDEGRRGPPEHSRELILSMCNGARASKDFNQIMSLIQVEVETFQSINRTGQDWKSESIVHHCKLGCCRNIEESSKGLIFCCAQSVLSLHFTESQNVITKFY